MPTETDEEDRQTVTAGSSGELAVRIRLAVVVGPPTEVIPISKLAEPPWVTIIIGGIDTVISAKVAAVMGSETGFQVSPLISSVAVHVSGVEAVGAN